VPAGGFHGTSGGHRGFAFHVQHPVVDPGVAEMDLQIGRTRQRALNQSFAVYGGRENGGGQLMNQLYKNCIHPSVGVLRSLEGETMILGRFTLAMFLLTSPAIWAQYSRADMMKLATDRFDTAAKTLNLSADQVAAIKPLLQSRYIDMGQVKDVYMASDKSDASKKTAKESLKAIHDKYNTKINAILTPEQSKAWKRLQKDWKDDLIMPKS
jgi:hypothetical protein